MNDRPSPAPGTGPAAEGGRPSSEPPPHPAAIAIGVGVAVALVLLDQLTKELVESVLVPGRFVPWLGPSIGWQLIYNPGGAFGLPAPHWLFLVVTVGVVVLVARVLPRAPTALAATAYGMLLSGAVGNVLDRLLRPGGDSFGSGYVVDFVAWGNFPRFNVADSAITVGFVLLVLALLQEERRAARIEAAVAEQHPPPAAPEPVGPPAPGDAGDDGGRDGVPDGHDPGGDGGRDGVPDGHDPGGDGGRDGVPDGHDPGADPGGAGHRQGRP